MTKTIQLVSAAGLNRRFMRDLSEQDLLSLLLGEEWDRGLDLLGLSNLEYTDLFQLGLKGDLIVRLMAAFELGWRLSNRPWKPGEVFQGSEQIFRCFRSQLGRETVEMVWVLLLDARLRKMGLVEVSRGTVTGAIVHPREVLHPVVTRQVPAFILLHNHPSGEVTPSQAHFLITRQIAQAADIFCVDFLDHIILTPYAYYSFADNKKM